MSSVRMCDRCGDIFSERADGWSSFTGTTRRKNEKGEFVNQTDSLDSCPECTELMTTPQQRPRPALGTSVAPHYETDTQAAATGPASG